jgi:hypothetical protein
LHVSICWAAADTYTQSRFSSNPLSIKRVFINSIPGESHEKGFQEIADIKPPKGFLPCGGFFICTSFWIKNTKDKLVEAK